MQLFRYYDAHRLHGVAVIGLDLITLLRLAAQTYIAVENELSIGKFVGCALLIIHPLDDNCVKFLIVKVVKSL